MEEHQGSDILSIDVEERVIDQHTISFGAKEDLLTVVYTNCFNFYVTVPSLCSALSLNAKGQVQRIKRTPVLMDGFRALMLATRGGRQRTYCLHVEWIGEWLAGL